MPIALLKNADVFLIFLRLIMRMLNRANRSRLIFFAQTFCGLTEGDINRPFEIELLKIFKERRRQLHQKNYVQLQVSCDPPSKLLIRPEAMRSNSSLQEEPNDDDSIQLQTKLRRKVKSIASRSQFKKIVAVDKSREYADVLARSVFKLKERQRRTRLQPNPVYIANEYFLQKLLAHRKQEKPLFILTLQGGLWNQTNIIRPGQKKTLFAAMLNLKRNRGLRITLRKLQFADSSGCCQIHTLGRWHINTSRLNVMTGTRFQLVSSLGDEYIQLNDKGVKNPSMRSEASVGLGIQEFAAGSMADQELSTDKSRRQPLDDQSETIVRQLREQLVERSFKPSFDIQIQWCVRSPFEQLNRGRKAMSTEYIKALQQHIKLLKYVMMRRLRSSHMIHYAEVLDQLLVGKRIEKFLGPQLKLLLNEHAFQNSLDSADHLHCIRMVASDIRLMREDFLRPGGIRKSDTLRQLAMQQDTEQSASTVLESPQIGRVSDTMDDFHPEPLQSMPLHFTELGIVEDRPSEQETIVVRRVDRQKRTESSSTGQGETGKPFPVASKKTSSSITNVATKTEPVSQAKVQPTETQRKKEATPPLLKLQPWIEEIKDVRPLERLSEMRLLQWQLIGGAWTEKRFYRLQSFDKRSMMNQYLDDFDLTSQSVCVRVTKGFGSGCSFVRFSTKRSLAILPFDGFLRQFAIRIICDRNYQALIVLVTVLQLLLINLELPQKRFFHLCKMFTTFFTIDLMLNVAARGLFLHSYSYLKNAANIVFTVIGMVSWAVIIILKDDPVETLPPNDFFDNNNTSSLFPDSKSENSEKLPKSEMEMTFVRGFYQLIVLFNLLRISRKLSRMDRLKPLRLFIKILLSLLPQLVPVALLIVYGLHYYSELVIRLFPRLFRHVCVPAFRRFQLEYWAITEGKKAFSDYDFFEQMEESYTRINYNNSLYLFDYRPCGVLGKRETYLGDECEKFDECRLMSNHFLMLVGRLTPDLLSFENFRTVFMILAMGMFNQNFDIYFYRMIRHGGITAFLIGSSLYAFGFLMLSLVLSMIYDTYQDQMCKLRMFSSTTHYYYTGEYEFSFDADNTKVCLRSSLMEPVERHLLSQARPHQQRLKNQFLMKKEARIQDDRSAFQQQMLQLIHLSEQDANCNQALQRFNVSDSTLDSTVCEYLRQCRKLVCDHMKQLGDSPLMINFRLGNALLQKNLFCDQWPLSQPYDPTEMHNMQLVHRGRHTQILPPENLNIETESKSIKKTESKSRMKSGQRLASDASIKTYLKLEKLEALAPEAQTESTSQETDQSGLEHLEKLLFNALQTIQLNRINRAKYMYIYASNYLNEFLQRTVHYFWFRLLVDFFIFFKFLFFLIYLQRRQYFDTERDQLIVQKVFMFVNPILSKFFVIEFSLRLAAGGWNTARSNLFCFDFVPYMIDICMDLAFDYPLYLYSNLRVLYTLYQRWPLLHKIYKAIAASRIELGTNVILFCLVYTFLVLYGIRFLFAFQVEKEDEDFLRMELDFTTVGRALRTVYLTVVGFAWQEISSQYLLFNEEIEPGIYFFSQNRRGDEIDEKRRRYIEQIPFAISIFVIINIVYSLFFRNLFIPQIFHYLDLNYLLHINISSLKAINTVDRIADKQPKYGQTMPNFRLKMVWLKFKQYLLNPLLYGIQISFRPLVWIESKLRAVTFLLNLIGIYYLIVLKQSDLGDIKLSKKIKHDRQTSKLAFGMVIHSLLAIDLIFRILRKGLLLFFLGKGSLVPLWRFFASSIDTVSLIYAFKWLTNVSNTNNIRYDGDSFDYTIAMMGTCRLIRLYSRSKIWMKSICLLWVGFFQTAMVTILTILCLAIVGSAFYDNSMQYCSLTTAGWFYQKTKRIAVGTSRDPLRCAEEAWKSDFFVRHELSIFKAQQNHLFNFQGISNSVHLIVHMMFGSDIYSTIELLTSISDFRNTLEKESNQLVWLYIISITICGLVLDAFLFSIIARHMSHVGNFSASSIFRYIQDRAMVSTYLAMEGIRHSLPWQNVLYAHQTLFKRILFRLVNNRLYSNIQFAVLMGNPMMQTLSREFLSLQNADALEKGLLIFHLLDGLFRLGTVQGRILQYPMIMVCDFVFPIICCCLHLSGIHFGLNMRWSLFLPARILLLPDRYLTPLFMRGPRMLLRTLSSGATQLKSMCLLMAGLLIMATAIGRRQFENNDRFGDVYSPPELPPTFHSFFFTFAHLLSVTFSNTYDVAFQSLKIRSEFCSNSDIDLKENQHMESVIRTFVDESPPTLLYYGGEQAGLINVDTNKHSIPVDEIKKWIHLEKKSDNSYSTTKEIISSVSESRLPDEVLFYCVANATTSKIHLEFSVKRLRKLNDLLQTRCLIIKQRQRKVRFAGNDENCDLTNTNVLKQKNVASLNTVFHKLLHYEHIRFQKLEQLKHNNISQPISKLQVAYALCKYRRNFPIHSRDRRRINSQALLDQLVERHLYMNVRKALWAMREKSGAISTMKTLQKRCQNQWFVLTYYLLLFIIARMLILNMIRAVVLSRYGLERLRETNNFLPQDIEDFINGWRIYCMQLQHKMVGVSAFTEKELPADPAAAAAARDYYRQTHMQRTAARTNNTNNIADQEQPTWHNETPFQMYLPIRYALLFLREMAPLKFRLPPCSEESALCILGRYALRVREEDMTVHAIDLLAVCCAHRLNCSPNVFQRDYRHILTALADYIHRECPDYDFENSRVITMPTYLNGFYFGKLILNSVIQRQVLGHFLLDQQQSQRGAS